MDPFFVNEEDNPKQSFPSAFKFGHHTFERATFKNWTTVNATFPRTWTNVKQVMENSVMTVAFICLFVYVVSFCLLMFTENVSV